MFPFQSSLSNRLDRSLNSWNQSSHWLHLFFRNSWFNFSLSWCSATNQTFSASTQTSQLSTPKLWALCVEIVDTGSSRVQFSNTDTKSQIYANFIDGTYALIWNKKPHRHAATLTFLNVRTFAGLGANEASLRSDEKNPHFHWKLMQCGS